MIEIVNVVDTGSTVTIDSVFVARSLAAETAVVMNITYGAGMSYLSSTPSAGVFDGATWTVDLPMYDDTDETTRAATIETLDIVVTIDNVAIFSAGTRLVTMTAPPHGGETDTTDNVGTREVGGVTCTDISTCVGVAPDTNFFNNDLTADADRAHDGAGFDVTITDVDTWSHTSSLVDPGSGSFGQASIIIKPNEFNGAPIELNADDVTLGRNASIKIYPGAESQGIVFNESQFGKYQFETPPFQQGVEEYSLQQGVGTNGNVRIFRQYTKVIYTKRVRTITSVDSPYTIDPLVDDIVFVDSTGGAIIINFPQSGFIGPTSGAAVSIRMGVNNATPLWNASHEIVIKIKNDPTVNNITLEPNGAETIQDNTAPAANMVLGAGQEGRVIRVVTDGSNLFVV